MLAVALDDAFFQPVLVGTEPGRRVTLLLAMLVSVSRPSSTCSYLRGYTAPVTSRKT
jgi:hypothetical protein